MGKRSGGTSIQGEKGERKEDVLEKNQAGREEAYEVTVVLWKDEEVLDGGGLETKLKWKQSRGWKLVSILF